MCAPPLPDFALGLKSVVMTGVFILNFGSVTPLCSRFLSEVEAEEHCIDWRLKPVSFPQPPARSTSTYVMSLLQPVSFKNGWRSAQLCRVEVLFPHLHGLGRLNSVSSGLLSVCLNLLNHLTSPQTSFFKCFSQKIVVVR